MYQTILGNVAATIFCLNATRKLKIMFTCSLYKPKLHSSKVFDATWQAQILSKRLITGNPTDPTWDPAHRNHMWQVSELTQWLRLEEGLKPVSHRIWTWSCYVFEQSPSATLPTKLKAKVPQKDIPSSAYFLKLTI